MGLVLGPEAELECIPECRPGLRYQVGRPRHYEHLWLKPWWWGGCDILIIIVLTLITVAIASTSMTSIIGYVASTMTTTWTSTFWEVHLGRYIYASIQGTILIQGVVIMPVDRALEYGHESTFLVSIQVGLPNPGKIR
jgi:hypothetical protein